MLGNSGKRRSKYGTFYDSPVLLTLVLSTSARRQSAAENPVLFLQTQSRNFMDNGRKYLRADVLVLTTAVILQANLLFLAHWTGGR
jgi:hypothetical protein